MKKTSQDITNDALKPIVWTIAGSDSGGGAGIQADLHTFQALGAYGCSVITAITAQNTLTVTDMMAVDVHYVEAQINALQADLPAKAIKLGMLGNSQSMQWLPQFIKQYTKDNVAKIILDPVMVAGCGDKLFFNDIHEYKKLLADFFPYIDLITPNIPEAEILTDSAIHTYQDMQQAAEKLISQGVKNVLIKGGHFEHDPLSQDYWTNGRESFWLSSKRYFQKSCHGTGCTLSSAIAALLALKYELKEALVVAKMYVSQGIRYAQSYGKGLPPVQHVGFPNEGIDLPYVVSHPMEACPIAFAECGDDLGLYPIVESANWLETLLPLGIKTIQLRIKNKIGDALAEEIKNAIIVSEKYGARLFINDHWELAIQYHAYGVHLGQEDLIAADIEKIRKAGLRLGLSTHSYKELATAHAFHPSYIAFGPIFPTTSKVMPFSAQGIARLKKMRQLISYPLVAIGGIDVENIATVDATGVNGIAMISAITKTANPTEKTKQLLKKLT